MKYLIWYYWHRCRMPFKHYLKRSGKILKARIMKNNLKSEIGTNPSKGKELWNCELLSHKAVCRFWPVWDTSIQSCQLSAVCPISAMALKSIICAICMRGGCTLSLKKPLHNYGYLNNMNSITTKNQSIPQPVICNLARWKTSTKHVYFMKVGTCLF